MAKEKYKYNPKSLSYEKVDTSFKRKFFRFLFTQFSAAIVIAVLLLITVSYFVDSPEVRDLKRENQQLESQYEVIQDRIKQLDVVVEDLEERDKNIYRAIFESEPPPLNNHQSDQGLKYFEKLESVGNHRFLKENSNRIEHLYAALNKQQSEYKELLDKLKSKKEVYSFVPSIMPIHNPDFKHQPYGYGTRIDPIYKTPSFHSGIDFAAPRGTEVYATADGKVLSNYKRSKIHGKYIKIKHKEGFSTLYAHLDKIIVRPGTKVKRGDLIGYIGDTGKSICPHLHYEVHKDGKPVNPINFFFDDLSPKELDKLVELASMSGQALD